MERHLYGDRGVSPLEAPLVQGRALNGTYRRLTRRGRLLTVQMMTSHQLCLGHHQGVSARTETPRFPSTAHTEHRVLSLPPDDRPNVPPDPDPSPEIWPVSMGIRLFRKLSLKAALTLLMVRTPHRAIFPWARYLQDRSPWSESICPVERPSSCDTGHYARLATKGSVQQSPVDRPVYSEHARSHRDPVNLVTVYRLGPGTRNPIPVLGFTEHTG